MTWTTTCHRSTEPFRPDNAVDMEQHPTPVLQISPHQHNELRSAICSYYTNISSLESSPFRKQPRFCWVLVGAEGGLEFLMMEYHIEATRPSCISSQPDFGQVCSKSSYTGATPFRPTVTCSLEIQTARLLDAHLVMLNVLSTQVNLGLQYDILGSRIILLNLNFFYLC